MGMDTFFFLLFCDIGAIVRYSEHMFQKPLSYAENYIVNEMKICFLFSCLVRLRQQDSILSGLIGFSSFGQIGSCCLTSLSGCVYFGGFQVMSDLFF
jgi:hypothetical protein